MLGPRLWYKVCSWRREICQFVITAYGCRCRPHVVAVEALFSMSSFYYNFPLASLTSVIGWNLIHCAEWSRIHHWLHMRWFVAVKRPWYRTSVCTQLRLTTVF